MPEQSSLSPQEQNAIDAIVDLGLVPIDSPFPARAIAEALNFSEAEGEEILDSLQKRRFIELQYEHASANNLAETGHVLVNERWRWVRVAQ